MVQVEIAHHTINVGTIYSKSDKYNDVELFFEDLVTGESESCIMHQLSVWSNGIYPNIRDEFKVDEIEEIVLHHKKWNSPRNFVLIVFTSYSVKFVLSDNQMAKVEKIVNRF